MSKQHNTDESRFLVNRRFYELLLAYIDSELASCGDKLPSIVAYLMRDGSIKFSVSSPVGIMVTVIEESLRSDRLLVILCVAYLEDQIRLSLAKCLARDSETSTLLDPERLPFLAAARLAFSLGLIAKEWLEILKEMAKFRNKFAHDPSAQSFEDLIEKDAKRSWKSLDQLSMHYKKMTQEELNGTIHGNFIQIFLLMYSLLQFSLDHISAASLRQVFNSGEIVGINHTAGLTREFVQAQLDQFDES